MAQKPNKRRKKPSETPNVTGIATRAGCSRTLVLRLLRRGFSEQQIIDRVRERKAREHGDRHANGRVNGHVNGYGMEFPVVPVPGLEPIPPFAESERKKEFHLARLRELQVARLAGTALPLEPLRSVIFASTRFLTNRLRDLPDELADELGQEMTKTLRARIRSICDEAQRVMCWECQRHGVVPPPPEPPRPVQARLAYYQQYLKGSTSGEVETIKREQEIGTPEWFKLHPSIDFQSSFKYSALKKQWDADMAALLNRRREWDLPSELPDQPPPEEPDEDQPA